mmetsp:Transcript_112292/g.328371  ORF Transcript_112292/g.328371 Transcript_112292/m.328371 type:complete len:184 (-) Transcript_112292:47-598(-)
MASMDLSLAEDGCVLDAWWAESSTVLCFLLGAALLNKRVTQHPLMQLLRRRAAEASATLCGGAASTSCKGKPMPGEADDDDLSTTEMFGLIQRSELPMEEGPCLRLLESCAEGQLPGLEAEVAASARQRLPLTPALCSALIRTYAHAGLHAEVRSLYEEALTAGVELEEEAEELYDAVLSKEL